MKIIKRSALHFGEDEHGMFLLATRIAGRSVLQFPPAEFIHAGAESHDTRIGPSGRIYSYTVVHAIKNQPPYGLAMVDIEPGVRVFGRLLIDERRPAIGDEVAVVPFALTDGTPDYAFSPL